MEDSKSIALLKLCRTLSQIHEMPTSVLLSCPTERMTHEAYKFHLGIDSGLDLEALEALCEDFKTCYLCFVMSVRSKSNTSRPILMQVTDDYLARLLREGVQLIESYASGASQAETLVGLGRFCEVIESAEALRESMQERLYKMLEKEVGQMKSAIEDLEDEEVPQEIMEYLKENCRYWEEVATRVLRREITDEFSEEIITACKEISKNIDYLACCYLDFGEESEMECAELRGKISRVYTEIEGISGMRRFEKQD